MRERGQLLIMSGCAVISSALPDSKQPNVTMVIAVDAKNDDIIVLDDEAEHADSNERREWTDDVTVIEDDVRNGDVNVSVKLVKSLNFDRTKNVVKPVTNDVDGAKQGPPKDMAKGNLFENLANLAEKDVPVVELNDVSIISDDAVEEQEVLKNGNTVEKTTSVIREISVQTDDELMNRCDVIELQKSDDVVMLDSDELDKSSLSISDNSEVTESIVTPSENERFSKDVVMIDEQKNVNTELVNEKPDLQDAIETISDVAVEDAGSATNIDVSHDVVKMEVTESSETMTVDLSIGADSSETQDKAEHETEEMVEEHDTVENKTAETKVLQTSDESAANEEENSISVADTSLEEKYWSKAEDELLADDSNDAKADDEHYRPSSAASVKSDILLGSPPTSPKNESDSETKEEVILVDASQSRKRSMSQSPCLSDHFVKKLRSAESSAMSDDKSPDNSDVGELLTVLSDELLHGLVRQKLNSILTKEIDQVVAPLRKRISDLQHLNDMWKEKVVNLQKQLIDKDLARQRADHKRGTLNKPAMRTVAVQVSTTATQIRNKLPAVMETSPPKSVAKPVEATVVGQFRVAPSNPARPVGTSQATVLQTTSQSLQTFVLSPQQTTTSGTTTAPSFTLSATSPKTVREMLVKRNYIPVSGNSTQPTTIVSGPSIVASKPATIQLPSGNRVVIDLTSDEEKRNKQLAVQGMVVPHSLSLQTQSNTSGQQSIILGGNNVPSIILQALNSNQANQGSILLAGQNNRNVISLVQTPSGLVPKSTTGTILSPAGPIQPANKVTGACVTATAVPIALQRASNQPVGTSLLNPIRVRVPVPANISPATATIAQSILTSPSVVNHPAPLPPSPLIVRDVNTNKRAPPRPMLKISRVAQGIVLSWNMVLLPLHEEITNYQLYAYQEGNAAPSTQLWKRVGDVKALPLPMACTLTQFQEGNKYHFAVRAVDKTSRVGEFSEPASIYLTMSKTT